MGTLEVPAGFRTTGARVPRQITPLSITPDGTTLLASYYDPGAKTRLYVQASADTGDTVKVMEGPWTVVRASTAVRALPLPQFTPEGRGISYVARKNGVDNIWIQPLVGGPAHQLTQFTDKLIFRYAWARDGKQIVAARGTALADAVLIRNLR